MAAWNAATTAAGSVPDGPGEPGASAAAAPPAGAGTRPRLNAAAAASPPIVLQSAPTVASFGCAPRRAAARPDGPDRHRSFPITGSEVPVPAGWLPSAHPGGAHALGEGGSSHGGAAQVPS